ncbi:hypothetical protein MMC09_002385 [Bachmanniomyces sp. S44760]|nr:hypothetical protein [Bachmanniomyces sp. S44760]
MTASHPTPHSIPPPQTFDFIPDLQTLLSNLTIPSNNTDGSSTNSHKDLAADAASIKIKINKARLLVDSLPDVGRTLEMQDAEISELHAKIDGLRAVLTHIVENGRGR